ncbi:MAG: RDD family protein [Verrucomicrobiaceae bacterium]|nr:RDD family protein [Verrucomicrobiaceae bacterium]
MKYHVARDGEKIGEFSDLDISAGLRAGEFKPTDICWHAGLKEWSPLSVEFPPPEQPVQPERSSATPPPVEGDFRWSALDDGAEGSLQPASLWQRFLGWWVDMLTILPAMLLFSNALGLQAFFEKNQLLPQNQLIVATQEHMQKVIEARPQDFVMPMNLLLGVGLLNVILLTWRGQTVGKLITGTRVVKHQTGGRAGFISVVMLRSFVMLVLTQTIPGVGLGIWLVDAFCIFRTDRRCLHDMIADTMVVRSR